MILIPKCPFALRSYIDLMVCERFSSFGTFFPPSLVFAARSFLRKRSYEAPSERDNKSDQPLWSSQKTFFFFRGIKEKVFILGTKTTSWFIKYSFFFLFISRRHIYWNTFRLLLLSIFYWYEDDYKKKSLFCLFFSLLIFWLIWNGPSGPIRSAAYIAWSGIDYTIHLLSFLVFIIYRYL